MLKNSPKRIGETIDVKIAFDSAERIILHHPKFAVALTDNIQAKAVFEGLSPSRQLEIVRYTSRLKADETVDLNVEKAVDFLLGKGRFAGRAKP